MPIPLPDLPSKFIGPLAALADPIGHIATFGNALIGQIITTQFPDDLQQIDHWVTFTAYDTKQALRLSDSKKEEKASIALPIPGNLQTAYNISYTETSLGALGAEFMNALGEGGDSDKSREFLTRNAVAGGIGAFVGGSIGALTGGSVVGSALTGAAGGLSASALVGLTGNGDQTTAQVAASTLIGTDQMAAAAASQFGVARNPHKVVLFESVGFRKHSFSYQFTPKNRDESETLRKIIYQFKYFASPGMNPKGTIGFSKLNSVVNMGFNDVTLSGGKHFFKYPEFFDIKFHHPKFLFRIGHSFLTSVDVNYQPAGAPTYARDSHNEEPAPTQINLSLVFTETDIVTKDNLSLDGNGR